VGKLLCSLSQVVTTTTTTRTTTIVTVPGPRKCPAGQQVNDMSNAQKGMVRTHLVQIKPTIIGCHVHTNAHYVGGSEYLCATVTLPGLPLHAVYYAITVNVLPSPYSRDFR